jgi:hypothetical protein
VAIGVPNELGDINVEEVKGTHMVAWNLLKVMVLCSSRTRLHADDFIAHAWNYRYVARGAITPAGAYG